MILHLAVDLHSAMASVMAEEIDRGWGSFWTRTSSNSMDFHSTANWKHLPSEQFTSAPATRMRSMRSSSIFDDVGLIASTKALFRSGLWYTG